MSNLRKRLITGTALALAMAGILYGDLGEPMTPFLLTCVILLQYLAICELVTLLRDLIGVHVLLTCAAFSCVFGVWYCHTVMKGLKVADMTTAYSGLGVAAVFLATFFIHLLFYDGGGQQVERMNHSQIALVWLGVLPCFLIAIRHLPLSEVYSPTLALAATIFVPKLGDVGAFFTGTLIGKHKMAPRLSPKKTWEGFAGGMVVAMLTAVGINELGREPLFKGGVLQAMLFGLVVGLAGVLGDLFESAIKRRAKAKDASASVPGFGGVLDVVDSVLFAAPAAYLFFALA